MPPASSPARRPAVTARRLVVGLLGALLVATGLVAGAPGPTPAHADTYTAPVMGPNVLTAAQLAAWYRAQNRAFNVPNTTIDQLASYYIDEGAAENVRGDFAFAQSIVETGYFGFVGSMVKPGDYNFAGMGACDSCSTGRQFPDARTGVRAQVQHLKNYADITSRAATLKNPPVVEWYGLRIVNGVKTYDPALAIYNFDTFFRKGAAPTWNVMGNGNWATATNYSTVVMGVYQAILRWNGLPDVALSGFTTIGNLEYLGRMPGGVRLSGWAFDTVAKNLNAALEVRLNGVPVTRVIANVDRPDVGAAYPDAGSAHGFDSVVPITSGGQVCVFAIGLNGLARPFGCAVVLGPNPIGRLDAISRVPGGVHIGGWAIDPDSASPVTVHLYMNGVPIAPVNADKSRPDVGAVYPVYGDNRGFDAVVPITNGGQACVYAVNQGPGQSVLFGCANVLGPTPLGTLDSATRVPGGVRVSGWIVDPDSADPVTVHVYANGVPVQAILADKSRPDVGAIFPDYGDGHGFDAVVPITNGGQVCVYAINKGAGTVNPLFGCKTVGLGATPIGSLDSVTRVDGGIRLTGWAVDPDSGDPVTLHVYVNGVVVGAITADQARGDVWAFLPPYGPFHGFDSTLPSGGGLVCVYAINQGAGTVNPLIGCRAV